MSSQNVTVFNFDGKFDVRTILDNNDSVLFVAKDVATALGYADTTQAVRVHCKRAKSLRDLGVVPGGVSCTPLDPQTKLIPESDVYRLTLKSTLPSADRFQDWVCEEVLPQIRKTGSYTIPQPSQIQTAIQASVQAAQCVAPFMDAAKAFGFEGNQAILSANRAVKRVVGVDVLDLMGQKALIAPDQEILLTVTEIEQRFGWKRQEGNKKLTAMGLQTEYRDNRKKLCYELTDEGRKYGVYLDTGKQHGNGTPIRQLKWKESVLAALKAADTFNLSFMTGA